MSNSIGKIEQLTGKATVVSPDGASSPAVAGMPIEADSVVTTEAGSAMVIRFSDGTTMNIGADEFVLIDKTVSDSEALAEDETQAEVDALKAILAESPDLSIFEETASGEAVAVGGSSLIVDSIEKHNDNSGTSGSSSLDQFASNKLSPSAEDDDQFGLVTDTTNPNITVYSIISIANPTVNGTVDDTDATVVVTINDTEYTAINNGDGTWELPNSDILPQGDQEITVVATDTNGNETTETTIITVDTIAPIITVDTTPTNDTTPTITGTVDDPTANIVVDINGDSYVADNNGDGTWSVTIPDADALVDNTYTTTVTATDTVGNETSITDTIIIDTDPTDVGDATVTLDIIGGDNQINATETGNITLSGSTTAADGETVTIRVNGQEFAQLIANGGAFTLDVEKVVFNNYPDSLYTVTAEVIADVAGNIASSSQEVVLDTDFTATITLDADLFGDSIINADEAQSEVLYITGTTTASNDTPVTITIDGVEFAQTAVVNGTFSVHIDPSVFNNYVDGTFELVATISDIAGNTSSDSQTITLDRSLDNGGDYVGEMITIDTITEDTGVDDHDFITSDNELTISGTYNDEPGNSIIITINATEYSIDNGNITLPGDGTWSIDTGVLPEGITTITAVITDTAGNIETITQDITIDTIADNGDGSTPAEITLDPISDGYINAQEAGTLVTVQGTSNVIGATVNITLNTGDFTSAVVQADGTYSVIVDTTTISTYADGSYDVKATIITDTAGNEVSAEQVVILDTTLDSGDDYDGDNVGVGSITIDTGIVGDYITADTTLIINGTFNAEAGNSVIVKVDNTVYDSTSTELSIDTANNTWTLNLEDAAFEQGVYTITAIISDTAGNSESTTQDITIVDSTDLGIINLDEISGNYINLEESQNDLEITGVSTAIGQTVTFELNNNPLIIGGVAVTAIVQADGTFAINIPADTFSGYVDGVYELKAKVTTTDGLNASDTEDVTLDRSTDDDNGTGNGGDGSDASIILDTVGDGYINQQESSNGLYVSGTTTAVEGTVITLYYETINGDKIAITTTANGQSITANADGTFSAVIDLGDLSSVDNSTLALTAEVVADKAGNIAASNTVDVDVDLSAGTLSDDVASTPVYESALDTGSNPSLESRSTQGNIFDNDTNIENSTISNITVDGVTASVLPEDSNILVADTDSGIFYLAIHDTTFNNIDYVAGDYVYVLQDASSSTSEEISYTLEDDAGNSSTANLSIEIVDDAPVANEDGVVHKYLDSNTAGYTTNLILTLDVSGSMSWDADGSKPGDEHYSGIWPFGHWVDDYDESTIRIDLAKDALQNLIDQYAELGDVNIQIITFGDTAEASTMLDAESAKNYIEAIVIDPDNGTYYDNAIVLAQQDIDLYPEANTTQFYFISDGQPRDNMSHDEWLAWNAYIDSSPIDRTIAIGVGDNGSAGELGNIANEYGETIIIDDITDLDGTLAQTVNNTIITGELTSFDADGTVIAIGADGGHITQLVLYNQDGSTHATVDYDASNPTQVITTELGATLTVNFNTGSYTYTIDYNNTLEGQQESMNITVLDNDGDAVTNGIYFHLETSADDNFAYTSVDLDGLAGFDTVVLSGTETLDFNNISNLSNIEAIDMRIGDNDIINLDVADIMNMTDADNILTIYGDSGDSVAKPVGTTETWTQVSTGVDDGNGHTVDVYNVSDGTNTVTVNIEQEIIVS